MYSSRKHPYPPHGRSLEIPRGRGGLKSQNFRSKVLKLNWNFLGGQGVQNKKPSGGGGGGVWIYSGTAKYGNCSDWSSFQLSIIEQKPKQLHWPITTDVNDTMNRPILKQIHVHMYMTSNRENACEQVAIILIQSFSLIEK